MKHSHHGSTHAAAGLSADGSMQIKATQKYIFDCIVKIMIAEYEISY